MKLSRMLMAIVGVSFALTACKSVKIENGQVPNEYLSEAKKYEGVYKGRFNGVSGELKITFEGNKPVLSFRDSKGNTDLIESRCNSRIGLLKVAYLGGRDDRELTGASFAFDPGACRRIVGQSVELSFDKNNKISLSIEADRRPERRCTIEGGGPNYPPRERCTTEWVTTYYRGSFSR